VKKERKGSRRKLEDIKGYKAERKVEERGMGAEGMLFTWGAEGMLFSC
jgi:hypothetical protein